uniref:Integrase catalytic domain-containing protein n=1 Tax=Tanacetum cinerariifolium TaxID=118510 RepID=A0A699HJW3_TANCI|nr:hypothetical protein [Tanacetum cinerariifolium]
MLQLKIENLNEVKVKELRSDNGTEFRNYKLEEFCDDRGISRNFLFPCIPDQNGVAERRNKTLIEAARTMLNSANLPKQFWGEAINTSCYTQNRSIIMKRHRKTAYDVFRGRSPDISLVSLMKRLMIDSFLATLQWPKISGISIPECFISIDSQHVQDSVSLKDHAKTSQNNNDQVLNETNHHESTENLEHAKVQTSVLNEQTSETSLTQTLSITNPFVPQDRWSRDKHIELVNIIGEPMDGVTTRSRVRGFEAASAHELYQIDVKSAFLNGKILEEVYVQQPLRFESSEFPNHVYKLDKALYGLKQAPRAWYHTNPKESQLVVVKRIFRYLKGTPNLGLWYPKGPGFDLKAYSDSDYARCNLDRKIEVEYVLTAGCCAQVLWIKSLLADYDVLYDKVPIFCDNTNAIAISNNPVLHSRTKHIDIRYHFIRDHILKGDIELYFIPTNLQLADIFTKPLAEPSFTRLVAELDSPLSLSQQVEPTPAAASNVYFQCEDSHIAFKNGIALLESKFTLYKDMLLFLCNHCISKALTIKPSVIYPKYLREYWYSAKVNDDTIAFSLSNRAEPLSFNCDTFSSLIGLDYTKEFDPLPSHKEYIVKCLGGNQGSHDQLNINQQMIAHALCWGVNINIAGILFSDLVSKLTVGGKKWREKNICYTRYLSIIMEHLMGKAYTDEDLTTMKPHQITKETFKDSKTSDVPLTAHMREVAKLPKQPLTYLSEGINAEDAGDKSLSETSMNPPANKIEVPVDATTSLDASKSVEEQENQPQTVVPKKEQDKIVREDEHKADEQHDDDVFVDSGLQASDESSETPVSDNSRQEVSHSEHTASTEFKSLLCHLDHVCKEVSLLHSKVEELKTTIAQDISDDIKSSMPYLISHSLKTQLPRLLSDALKDCSSTPQRVLDESWDYSNNENNTVVDVSQEAPKSDSAEAPKSEEIAMVIHQTPEDNTDYDELDKEPLSKKCKIITPIPEFPTPTPLYSIPPETTPPIDTSKGKGVATEETNTNTSVLNSSRNNSSHRYFQRQRKGTMSQEEFTKQIIEMKRLHDLKEQEKKSEKELKKLRNPETFKAQALKWEEHEEKKSKMLNEFITCISKRTSPFPITKISYVINSRKEPTMRITRDNDHLNLTEKNLGLPPPPELVTFGLTAKDMKRKRSEIIKEVFLTADVRIEGMHKNLIPPSGIMPIQGLVINEPESGIFFMNGNTNIDFQRESKFHFTPTIELI